MTASGTAFTVYSKQVRDEVEKHLASWLVKHRALANELHPEVGAIIGEMCNLATRGGKRFRAVLVAAAYDACGGSGGFTRVTWAGIAMEILQTYLLIHDDWMDGDDMRRGGPSVHAALASLFGKADAGAHAAILAGDYAAALALEAFCEIEVDGAHKAAAMREFARMQRDVVLGQILDMRGASSNPKDVEKMHALKTSSYTARGPLLLGATLAGASSDQLASLDSAAAPLGIAFQLRDDLLGGYGDPDVTGKPRGGDLRQGKRNALVVEASRDPKTQAAVERVLGHADAKSSDIDAALEAMVASGAKQRVESRLATLLDQARSVLKVGPFVDSGREVLIGAVDALGMREA